MTTLICDRCKKSVSRLTETHDDYGGKELCESCIDGLTRIISDMRADYIKRRNRAGLNYVNNVQELRPV